jgi:hypothetical protein
MDGVSIGQKWLVMSCIVEYKVNSKTKKQKTKMIDEIKLGISLSLPGCLTMYVLINGNL